MFSNFFDFVEIEGSDSVSTQDGFLKAFEGRTFLNGLYRIYNSNEVVKWTEIIKKSFPKFNGAIKLFGYDWLGRIFALDLTRNVTLIFEPGTGEILNTQVDFFDFHNKEITENHNACLASDFFYIWREVNGNIVLPHNKCAGYKVPLFLNGEDTVENLELSDMEVYWEIMMPLMRL
ncbi:MAG: DUF1851 domain-containing protein [Oscillospiraceae bacterium]|nr:DUF1851 domain-containing protein [Oscillospiraceae bacterium]